MKDKKELDLIDALKKEVEKWQSRAYEAARLHGDAVIEGKEWAEKAVQSAKDHLALLSTLEQRTWDFCKGLYIKDNFDDPEMARIQFKNDWEKFNNRA